MCVGRDGQDALGRQPPADLHEVPDVVDAEPTACRQLTPEGWNVWDIRFGGDRAVFWANSQTSPGALFELDLATGEPAWSFDAGESILASPAIAGGRLVIGTIEGRLYSFGKAD